MQKHSNTLYMFDHLLHKKAACSFVVYYTTNHEINFYSRNKLFDLMNTSFRLMGIMDQESLMIFGPLIHGGWRTPAPASARNLHLWVLDILVDRSSQRILANWQGGYVGPDAASEFRHTHWQASSERFRTPPDCNAVLSLSL